MSRLGTSYSSLSSGCSIVSTRTRSSASYTVCMDVLAFGHSGGARDHPAVCAHFARRRLCGVARGSWLRNSGNRLYRQNGISRRNLVRPGSPRDIANVARPRRRGVRIGILFTAVRRSRLARRYGCRNAAIWSLPGEKRTSEPAPEMTRLTHSVDSPP